MEITDEQYNKIISNFTCPQNKDVESFLHNTALRFEKTHNARTYLILNEDCPTEILAYFSLSFKEVILENSGISKNKVKQLDGISKKSERIRSFLIGQLAKNSNIENNTMNLKLIWELILPILSDAQDLIGGRVIILECEDCSKLISLYESLGFEILQKQEYVQMYMVFDPAIVV